MGEIIHSIAFWGINGALVIGALWSIWYDF